MGGWLGGWMGGWVGGLVGWWVDGVKVILKTIPAQLKLELGLSLAKMYDFMRVNENM